MFSIRHLAKYFFICSQYELGNAKFGNKVLAQKLKLFERDYQIGLYRLLTTVPQHANKLLIGLENSRDRSLETKATSAKTKTTKFWS